jgi:Tfp pilus assembly protein FimT
MMAVAAVAASLSLVASHEWINRQAARSAVYEVQSHLQLARAQAVNLNRSCRFLVDQATRRIQVVDLNDRGSSSDDAVLADVRLSKAIRFGRPDAGAPITLKPAGGTVYQATFAAEGSVSDAGGEIVVEGNQSWHKLTLYGAGGVGVEKWSGSSWSGSP